MSKTGIYQSGITRFYQIIIAQYHPILFGLDKICAKSRIKADYRTGITHPVESQINLSKDSSRISIKTFVFNVDNLAKAFGTQSAQKQQD